MLTVGEPRALEMQVSLYVYNTCEGDSVFIDAFGSAVPTTLSFDPTGAILIGSVTVHDSAFNVDYNVTWI